MLVIRMGTDNAAYRSDNGEDLDHWAIAESVAEVAARLRDGATKGNIVDYNGNRVGTFALDED